MFLATLTKYLDRIPANQIFFVDGVGALLSFVMLSGVLPLCGNLVGFPLKILYLLGLGALILAIFGLSVHFLIKRKTRGQLVVLALGNLTYCLVTLLFVILYSSHLGILGWWYFCGELSILAILINLELIIARKKKLFGNNE